MVKLQLTRLNMGKENGGESAAGKRRDCGYRYMMPSYVAVDEEHDPATSYRVLADALIENSSAHGLPTFYLARGFNLNNLPTSPFSVKITRMCCAYTCR